MVGAHGDQLPPAGAVELREDVPLKAGEAGGAWGSAGWCAGGPRVIVACFTALTLAISLALFTQIYYGDYEVVPHGSVASGAGGAACSAAGTDALKAGGRALDAAAATALCLAVAAPHRTSLDASGAMLYWEYRQLRTQKPILFEWGGAAVQAGAADAAGAARPPRLVAALAALHAEYGKLPWARLLQPAIDLARRGFVVSEGLALALAAAAPAPAPAQGPTPTPSAPPAGSLTTAPQLAAYLQSLQLNTSSELAAAWNGSSVVRKSSPVPVRVPDVAGAGAGAGAGGWRVWARGGAAARALAAALRAPPPLDLDDASRRVVAALQQAAASEAPGADGGAGVATGLAIVDSLDTYLALVTGLSAPFGSGGAAGAQAGWQRDEPRGALDLAPAVMVDAHVCGTRYVVGAESAAALAQVAVALAAGAPAPAAVERARYVPAPARAAPTPAPAVYVVQQRADALLSHADSRGGGLASRF